MENCAAKIKLIIIVYKLLQRFPLGQDMKLLLTRLYWYNIGEIIAKINRNRLIAFFPRYLRLHHFHSAVTRFHCIRIISTVFFFPIYIYLLRIIYIIAATCLLFRDDLYLRIRETSRGRARARAKKERERNIAIPSGRKRRCWVVSRYFQQDDKCKRYSDVRWS